LTEIEHNSTGSLPPEGNQHGNILPYQYPAWIAGIIALTIYYLTASPTISWAHYSADSGELASVAATLGIAHPPGYPLYTLIGYFLTRIFANSDPAWVLVLFSVFCGTVSAGIISRASSLALALIDWNNDISPHMGGWTGALAGLFIATTPLIWSQSINCEVYSLAILLQSIIWLLLVKYLLASKDQSGSSGKYIYGLAFVIGLIFAHHVGGGSVLLPILLILIFTWNKNSLKGILKAIPLLIPGLLFYLYLPLRSAQNPQIDWGNPENLGNFINHVSASIYREFFFATPPGELLERLQEMLFQNPVIIMATVILIIGLIQLTRHIKTKEVKALNAGVIPFLIWTWLFATTYWVGDYEVFYYPLGPPSGILIGIGILLLIIGTRKIDRFRLTSVTALLVILLACVITLNWKSIDQSKLNLDSAPVFTFHSLSNLPENSLVIAGSDQFHFPLLYGKHVGINISWTGESIPARTDIDVYPAQLLKLDWFHENMRDDRDYPVPVIPDYRGEEESDYINYIIELNIDYRPIYVDDQGKRMLEDFADNYRMTKIGALWEVHR